MSRKPNAPSPPGRLNRSSLADDVADAMRRWVLEGDLVPGQRLPTGAELATRFGVSMSVVREAMSRLKHDGLIDSVQGVGAFVATPGSVRSFRLDNDGSRADLTRIFELRQAIEGEAARLAATRRTDHHLQQLRTALSDMERALDSDIDGTQADVRFHQVVAQATGNTLFVDMYAFLSSHIDAAIEAARTHSARRGMWDDAHHEHQRIFEALQAGCANAARQATIEHIQNAARRLGLGLGKTAPGSLDAILAACSSTSR